MSISVEPRRKGYITVCGLRPKWKAGDHIEYHGCHCFISGSRMDLSMGVLSIEHDIVPVKWEAGSERWVLDEDSPLLK